MSLRLRLALWYGGLTGLVVVLVCLYSYAIHSRTHYDELDLTLARSAEHIVEELEGASPDHYASVLSTSLVLGTAIRLFDTAGRVTHESANADSVPPFDPRLVQRQAPRPPYGAIAALAPSFARVDPGRGTYGLLVDEAERRWRIYLLPLPRPAGLLGAVQPLTHLDRSVRGFARLMLFMAAVGAMAAFAVGWFLSGRALRPVVALTDTARGIARSQEFSRRVSVETARDELGKLAATFNEMLGSLEQAYSAQQRFVADASHELRAPLTVIQANLELLRRADGLPAAEQHHALQEAHAEAARLARLVADLLMLARADAGQALRRDVVELDRLLLDTLGEVRHLTSGQQLEVTAIEPLAVAGDADRLKQLLLILLDNAVRYTPAPGRVAVSLTRDASTAVVTVHDSGIGVPAEALPHVFERFYRADSARSRDPGGTGLGLPIARWIATQHGGTVDLASATGRGTTATIRLPLARQV